MVPSARLMLAEFLVWLALPALSSAPHFDGHQFSVHGASLTGPLIACAIAEPANAASTTPATIDSFMTYSFPENVSIRPVVLESVRRSAGSCSGPCRLLRDRRITPQPPVCCKL